MKYKYSFVLKIQFLGFRFSGWQKQTNAKTIHDRVDKSLSFVFGHFDFKTIGMSRTDAKVSANTYYMQMFTFDNFDNEWFLKCLNNNFSSDFKINSIVKVPINFNIINRPKVKEYHYYFSFGEKNHPFSAPFLLGLEEDLNISLMKKGALLFKGEHYFGKYCTKPSDKTILTRVIDNCEIIENTLLHASFFPKKSFQCYILNVILPNA